MYHEWHRRCFYFSVMGPSDQGCLSRMHHRPFAVGKHKSTFCFSFGCVM